MPIKVAKFQVVKTKYSDPTRANESQAPKVVVGYKCGNVYDFSYGSHERRLAQTEDLSGKFKERALSAEKRYDLVYTQKEVNDEIEEFERNLSSDLNEKVRSIEKDVGELQGIFGDMKKEIIGALKLDVGTNTKKIIDSKIKLLKKELLNELKDYVDGR